MIVKVDTNLGYHWYERKPAILKGVISRNKLMKKRAFCDLLISDEVEDEAIVQSIRDLQAVSEVNINSYQMTCD